MCGRLNITDDPFTIDLLKYFGVYLGIKSRLPLYNMGPSEQIPIIFENDGEPTSQFAIWSFLLEKTDVRWKPKPGISTFNAKAQRLNQSRLWRGPFKKKRCIIPATSFYEYLPIKDKKLPFLIKPADSAIAFAGLFREWHHQGDTVYSCALIVTLPHPKFFHVHRKSFPVIMNQESFDSWLDPKNYDTEGLEPLFEPRIRNDFEIIPTDPQYNSPSKKSPKCIEPVGKAELIRAD